LGIDYNNAEEICMVDVRELTVAELEEVSGGGTAMVAVEWVNGSGVAAASGSASTTAASASIAANFTSLGTGTPHELLESASVSVP
jgi:hypothetical protein